MLDRASRQDHQLRCTAKDVPLNLWSSLGDCSVDMRDSTEKALALLDKLTPFAREVCIVWRAWLPARPLNTGQWVFKMGSIYVRLLILHLLTAIIRFIRRSSHHPVPGSISRRWNGADKLTCGRANSFARVAPITRHAAAWGPADGAEVSTWTFSHSRW